MKGTKNIVHLFGITAFALIITFGMAACGQSENAKKSEHGSQLMSNPKNGDSNYDKSNGEAWKGQDEWEKTVAAAKKEGKLILSSPTSKLFRDVLMTFEKDYPEIKIEYIPGNSRDFWPRVAQERKIGQYNWDLRIGGPDTQVYDAVQKGYLDPIRAELVLPEVTDGSKWLGGFDGLFSDNGKKYVVGFNGYGKSDALINRDLVPQSVLDSTEQLIDPKFKGKIVIQDPRGGSGLGSLTVLLATHGEDYVKKLLSEQDIVVTGDARQLAEWVIRGRYPIGIGGREEDFLNFQLQGVKTNIEPLKGALGVSIGSGGIQLINNRPHPNAAKVFMNWLLTRVVQERLAKITQLNSRRLDILPGDPTAVLDPKQLDKYITHANEKFLPTRKRAQELADKYLK